jgi:hypothetical protein
VDTNTGISVSPIATSTKSFDFESTSSIEPFTLSSIKRTASKIKFEEYSLEWEKQIELELREQKEKINQISSHLKTPFLQRMDSAEQRQEALIHYLQEQHKIALDIVDLSEKLLTTRSCAASANIAPIMAVHSSNNNEAFSSDYERNEERKKRREILRQEISKEVNAVVSVSGSSPSQSKNKTLKSEDKDERMKIIRSTRDAIHISSNELGGEREKDIVYSISVAEAERKRRLEALAIEEKKLDKERKTNIERVKILVDEERERRMKEMEAQGAREQELREIGVKQAIQASENERIRRISEIFDEVDSGGRPFSGSSTSLMEAVEEERVSRIELERLNSEDLQSKKKRASILAVEVVSNSIKTKNPEENNELIV